MRCIRRWASNRDNKIGINKSRDDVILESRLRDELHANVTHNALPDRSLDDLRSQSVLVLDTRDTNLVFENQTQLRRLCALLCAVPHDARQMVQDDTPVAVRPVAARERESPELRPARAAVYAGGQQCLQEPPLYVALSVGRDVLGDDVLEQRERVE